MKIATMRLRRAVAATAAVLLMLLISAPAGLAWGPEAHRTIALIADRLLQQSDPAVRGKLVALLAGDKSNRLTKTDIASEATWPDVLRDKSPEARDATSPWHATRLKPDSPNLASACFGHTPLPAGYPASRGPRENCSVDKIRQFEAELKNAETSSFERIAAVQFLLNLVGDLHDPLLAIDAGDQGGFCVALQIGANPPVRLSSYWQETLPAQAIGADPAKGAARLMASLGSAELGSWPRGHAEDWAQESFAAAKTVAYGFVAEAPAGQHTFAPRHGAAEACPTVKLYRVGTDYESKASAAVKAQLQKAGVRLAAVLRDSLK